MGHVLQALLLTFMGAAGTALGGLMVVVQPRMQFQRLGALQGLAAGLMLSISIFDLLPESIEEIGFVHANVCFYVGVLLFAAVVYFIPEPDVSIIMDPVAAAKKDSPIPSGSSNLSSAHAQDGSAAAERARRKEVLMSGLIMAVGIALHNFPEGVAVFLAAQKSHAIGVSLAVAIALHNIPEGVAVALPVYFATGSRARGFRMAALSGLAEPFAVVVLALFFPAALPKQLVDAMLAGVGGIMAFLAFHELLPLAIQHAGKNAAVGSLFAGLALMSANLHLLNTYVLQGMH